MALSFVLNTTQGTSKSPPSPLHLITAPETSLSVQTPEFDTSDNHGDHSTVLHTLPLNLTLLQVSGVWETDQIGSERARPLLKATQLSHNRMEQRGLLDSKLQAGPIRKRWERTLRNEVWFRRHSPRGCRVSHA